nr:hypothetical protein [Paenibacillus daejeonensis]
MQTKSSRQKPTQRQLGEISKAVDAELKERSGYVCERCRKARAVERAHITGRKQLSHKTTVTDLLHLCSECHRWLDATPEGIRYRKELRIKSEAISWHGSKATRS